jgi:hypothetical protein
MEFDILALAVILIDLAALGFLLWRIFDKKATLWGNAKLIYGWVALLTLYHAVIYGVSLFTGNQSALVNVYLHPIVVMYMLNPLLIAIIHWRGGKL